MSLLTHFLRYARENGTREALTIAIRVLWESQLKLFVPHKLAVYNGVIVRDAPPNNPFSPTHDLGDHLQGLWSNVVRRHPFVYRDYEGALVESIRGNVKPGDDVVVIGGGRGVTTVVSAERVRKDGTVTTYEGAKERVLVCEETVTLNNVDDICTVNASIVGAKEKISGKPIGEYVTPVSSLPSCDVLEMDCEGAETTILRDLEIRPQTIIVETHGVSNPRDNQVADLLAERGYEVQEIGLENEEAGCYILTAEYYPSRDEA